jgi:hypothetical protein
MADDATCSVDDCDRDVLARGWCAPHYHRWYRTGNVHADVPVAAHAGMYDGREREVVEHPCPGPRCTRKVANYADTPEDERRRYCSPECYREHRRSKRATEKVFGMWKP